MASYHTRSNSFPSKSHPVEAQLNEQLRRLSSSQAASTSSLTNNLTGLVELYKCVGDFLQLPQNHKTLTQTQWVEKILDGSVRLLDICSTSRDVLVQSKEQLQDIQSVLRRRCNNDNMTNEFAEYQQSRKSAKKLIKKCLKDMKEIDETNDEVVNATETMLKDVQAMTATIFKSLLSYIGGSQKSGWSFSKKTASVNKFDAVDELMISQKKKANLDMSEIVHLKTEVQELDEVLESLFRHLIKTRAALLNVLSN